MLKKVLKKIVLKFLLLMGKILNDSPNQEDLRNIFTGQQKFLKR
jgi:hypothetical protein